MTDYDDRMPKLDTDALRSGQPTTLPLEETTDRVVVTGRPSRFGIDEARAELNLNGILQSNRFIVMLSLPPGVDGLAEYSAINDPEYVKDNHLDADNFISLRCENVQIPGVNFFTNDDVRRYGIGQIEKRPYLPTFNPIRLQFVVDRNAKVLSFFNTWTNAIVNYNTDLGFSPRGRKYKPYLLTYRDTYMSPTIRIWIYDQTNLNAFGIKLYDAFPIQTADIDLSWGNDNEAMRYSVVMQYSHMSMQFTSMGKILDAEAKERYGISPKSSSDIIDAGLLEYKKPDLLSSILDTTGKLIQGEIYSGAERQISKAFDRIFK
jgi:hypothetical protein